jgi:hypothetical protein
MLDELFRRKSVERILKESESQKMEAEHKIPMILFTLVATSVTVLSFVKRLSLILVLGLLTCFYLDDPIGNHELDAVCDLARCRPGDLLFVQQEIQQSELVQALSHFNCFGHVAIFTHVETDSETNPP